MNDFFSEDKQEELNKALAGDDKDKGASPEDTPAEKIKIGDKEYDQSSLSELVGLGEHYREIETKYNTKLDKVWPEYSKSQNRIKELEEELKKREMPADPAQMTEEQRNAARQALVNIMGAPIMTEADFKEKYQQERASERLLETLDNLESDINGSDGRPAFKKIDVLEYMRDNGLKDPEKAYKLMHEDKLDEWRTRKIEESRKPGFVTQEQGATLKTPKEVKVTRDNLQQLLSESLNSKIE